MCWKASEHFMLTMIGQYLIQVAVWSLCSKKPTVWLHNCLLHVCMYLTELESKIVVCTIDDSSILILHFFSLNHFVITLSPRDSHAVTDN